MKERPILFSAPMVRAILAGAKTQTRRIVKPRNDYFVEDGVPYFEAYVYAEPETPKVPCPYGAVGDRLWVRETFGILKGNGIRTVYRADGQPMTSGGTEPVRDMKWHPSIFMRRQQSRITLEVTGVRVERLHAITEEDAKAEGVPPRITTRKVYPSKHAADVETENYRDSFQHLWGKINGAESWISNPFVWVVSFKRVEAQARAA